MPHRPEALILSDPQVLKAVGDPLRRRILTEFCGEPVTTKQVAQKLGIRSNKLYHHVSVLADAGLLELVGTKAKRGTTEKYYQAVAHSFVMDPVVLQDGQVHLNIQDGTVENQGDGVVSPMVIRSRFFVPPDKLGVLQSRIEEIARELCDGGTASVECSVIAVAYRAAS